MQKITPNLWFNGNAKEAVDFYVSVFKNSKILATEYYPKTAEEGLADFQKDLAGDVLTIEFELDGVRFAAINAGPELASARRCLFQSPVKTKPKSIISGKNYLVIENLNNVAGVRISTA